MAALLIDRGAKVDQVAVSDGGTTPLYVAALVRHNFDFDCFSFLFVN